jgi:hypothetical protein
MKQVIAKSILALAAGAGVFAIPATAKADHRDHSDFFFRIDKHDNCEPRRVWVEPVYEERTNRVWVEPVYRTECVRIPVAGHYETRCDRVWVEPVWEVREVVRYEHGRRYCGRERVCVRPGHYENVERRIWVPGGERVEDRQVLVTAGHFEDRCERVCVREGYWRTIDGERPRERFTFGFGFGH